MSVWKSLVNLKTLTLKKASFKQLKKRKRILALMFTQSPRMINVALTLKTDKNYICPKNEFYSSYR